MMNEHPNSFYAAVLATTVALILAVATIVSVTT